MDKTEVVTEVPEPLKKLLKFIMRAFYTTEETLIMDLLLRNACMKEEDVTELLKLDKKQMGVSIKRLKSDQFIKTRMKVESDSEGKTTKHNYYFIHYTGFVNVVKYKLDHVRRKLEVQERDSTSRASFKCNICRKTYTDLEADHLFNLDTGTFNCMMCGCEMEEQQSSAPVKDARALVAKFNEQMEKLFILLKDCDKYKLSHTILDPAPIDINQLSLDRKQSQQKNSEKNSGAVSSSRTWSGDATKNIEFGLQAHTIDIKLGDDATAKQSTQVKKEQPAWMSKSTIDGVNTAFLPSAQDTPAVKLEPEATGSTTDTNIMHTLLVHENKPAAPANLPAAALGGGSDKSDDSDMEEVNNPNGIETMQESDEEEEVFVTVGDKKVPIHEAAEMVDLMTDEERETYNKIAQSLYNDMYY